MGGVFPLLGGGGGDFQELGHFSLVHFTIGLGTVMAPGGVSFSFADVLQ